MFDCNFIWLFIAFFILSAIFGAIFPFNDDWSNFYKDKLAPKTDWRSRLKYAIPVWIVALFFLCIMVLRFVNPQDYALKHGIERLHISILFCIYTASILIGTGFYILRFRKCYFSKKVKIIRMLYNINLILSVESLFYYIKYIYSW